MILFFYEANYFVSGEIDLITERGAVFANSFSEATVQIEEFYGDELDSVNVRATSEGCPLLFPDKETYQTVMEVNI